MHTKNPENTIPRAYQKIEKKKNKKKHTENPEREIQRCQQKNTNTSSSKPNDKKETDMSMA